MKKWILNLVFILVPMAGFSQDVMGRWKTNDNNSVVEIFLEDGVCKGKVVWLSKETSKDGKPLLDSNNRNKALRSRPILGMTIIDGMKKDGNEWKGGKVYDPESGKSYDCILKTVDGKLHVRGFVGPFGKTMKWEKSDIDIK